MKVEVNNLDFVSCALAESLLFLGNGFLGVRNILEEDVYYNKGTYINGFYEDYEIEYDEAAFGFSKCGEEMVGVIDAQSTLIYCDGYKLDKKSKISKHKRYVDLKEGKYTRTFNWYINDKTVNVEIEKIISFKHKGLFVAKYKFSCIDEIDIKIKTHITNKYNKEIDINDPRQNHNTSKLIIKTNDIINNRIHGVTLNSKLNLFLTYKQSHTTNNILLDDGCELVSQKVGKKIEFVKELNYSTEDYIEYDTLNLYESQREIVEDFWSSCEIIIDDNEKLQLALSYNLYSIFQSTGTNGLTSIAAKGLSGDGYKGHYFWDSEIYVVPFYTYTKPEIAKKLLMYRVNTLQEAKKNAISVGYHGCALYPWRTIRGKESSSFFEAGFAQHHINCDISYAFIKYYEATDDIDFLKNGGLETMIEIARLWPIVGSFKDDRFSINKVTGPDEYTALVNNNYYTNSMVKYTLSKLLELIETNKFSDIIEKTSLTDEEINIFKQITEKIVLEFDKELNITKQDSEFLNLANWPYEINKSKSPLLIHYHPLEIYRYQICKQPDALLAHVLLNDVSSETLKNTTNYYEKITTHDSSLSYSIFSILHSKLKNEELGLEYLNKTLYLDILNTHNNTKDGVHIANMAGTWMSVIYGFLGFKIIKNKVSFSPSIPKNLGTIKTKLKFKNTTLKITASSEKIYIENYDGQIYLNDELVKIISEGEFTL